MPVTIEPVPLDDVEATGPITGLVGVSYDFTAVIQPPTATQPITYTWQATGQSEVVHVGATTDMVAFTWLSAGTYTVTVTADNGLNSVTDSHVITVEEEIIVDPVFMLYLPFVAKP